MHENYLTKKKGKNTNSQIQNQQLNKQQAMHREIEAYLQHINFAKNCFVAYDTLYRRVESNEQLLCKAVGFFTVTQYALCKCLLIELAKLFIKHKSEGTIQRLINKVQANNDAFTKGNAIEICSVAQARLDNELNPIVQKLRSRRDQDLTHNDLDYFYGETNPALVNYISPNECNTLFDYAFCLCEDLLQCLPESNAVVLDCGADDFGDFIEWIVENQYSKG